MSEAINSKSLSAHKHTTFNVNKLRGELWKRSLKGKKRASGNIFGIELMSSENCIPLDHRHKEDVVGECEIQPTRWIAEYRKRSYGEETFRKSSEETV
jgi:hypothetical protein